MDAQNKQASPSQNQQSQQTDESKLTLEQFISENDKVLTVIGVFIALAAFWLTLPLKTISTFLAFLCIIATFPLFFELYKKLFSAKGTLNLTIFTNIFTLLAGYSIWYVLIEFRRQWKTELSKVVFWTILLTVLYAYRWLAKGKLPKLIEKWIHVLFLNPLDKIISRIQLNIYCREYRKSLEKTDYSTEKKKQALINYKDRLQKVFSMNNEELINSFDSEEARNEREKRNKRNKIIDFLFATTFKVLFLLLLSIYVSRASTQVADYINNKLDVIYESYKQEEQNLANPSPTPVAAPSPENTPVSTPTPQPTSEAAPSPVPTQSITATPTPQNIRQKKR